MAVKITNVCINCDACLNECPSNSIINNIENENEDDIYFVEQSTCTECIGDFEHPACVQVCPVVKCIVWDNPNTEGKIDGTDCYEES